MPQFPLTTFIISGNVHPAGVYVAASYSVTRLSTNFDNKIDFIPGELLRNNNLNNFILIY